MNSIIGHESQKEIIKKHYHNSYSWIIHGKKGIGKFSLIKNLVQQIANDDDLLIIDSPNIKVDDAHSIIQFLNLTSLNGKTKVVIIDNFENINYNASNALLKILEEPVQKSLIFIIAHNPIRIIPTIKSRARMLEFLPLSNIEMQLLFHQQYHNLFPIASGSPGILHQILQQGGLAVYKEILNALICRNIRKEFSELIMYIFLYIINKKAKILNGLVVEEIFPEELQYFSKIKLNLFQLFALEKQSYKLYDDANNFYLDKQYVSSALFA